MLQVMKALATDSKGVMVHASTLGALEALLQFLREGAVRCPLPTPSSLVFLTTTQAPFELDVFDRLIDSQFAAQGWLKTLFVILTVRAICPSFHHIECKPAIPVSHINIGPIYKKDVMRANIMNEKNLPEFATILAFDVKVDSEAQSFADENKVCVCVTHSPSWLVKLPLVLTGMSYRCWVGPDIHGGNHLPPLRPIFQLHERLERVPPRRRCVATPIWPLSRLLFSPYLILLPRVHLAEGAW
jgi:hypothetical protein